MPSGNITFAYVDPDPYNHIWCHYYSPGCSELITFLMVRLEAWNILGKLPNRSISCRAACRYKFFDINTNTDATYQFDPYRDIHVTISSKVRLFYTENWETCHQEHHKQPTAAAWAVEMCSGNCHRAFQGSVHISNEISSFCWNKLVFHDWQDHILLYYCYSSLKCQM